MCIKAIVLIIFILSLSQGQIVPQNNWQESKTSHFIIYSPQGKEDFAAKVAARTEEHYLRISDYFGYTTALNFWAWENRVKIYLYPNKSSYLKATSLPEWSVGVADYKKRAITSFVDCENFLDSTLPHEIAHLMFRDFVGLGKTIPVWLDEGVAIFSEAKQRQEAYVLVKAGAKDGSLLPFKNLVNMDTEKVKSPTGLYIRPAIGTRRETVMFLTGESLINLYYSQSASLVSFLIEQYGSQRFTNFCRGLRDGKTVDEALQLSYPNLLDNSGRLEKEWLQYLRQG